MLSSFSWLGTEIQSLQLFSKLCRRQYVCATLSYVGCGCINKRLKCGVELHSDISLRSNTHSLRCGVKPQNKKVGKQTTRKPFQLPRPCFHDGTGTRPPTSLPFPNFPILPKLSTFTNIPWPPATFLFHQFKDHTCKEKRGKLRESMIRNMQIHELPACRQIGSPRRDVAHISRISILDCSVTRMDILHYIPRYPPEIPSQPSSRPSFKNGP